MIITIFKTTNFKTIVAVAVIVVIETITVIVFYLHWWCSIVVRPPILVGELSLAFPALD